MINTSHNSITYRALEVCRGPVMHYRKTHVCTITWILLFFLENVHAVILLLSHEYYYDNVTIGLQMHLWRFHSYVAVGTIFKVLNSNNMHWFKFNFQCFLSYSITGNLLSTENWGFPFPCLKNSFCCCLDYASKGDSTIPTPHLAPSNATANNITSARYRSTLPILISLKLTPTNYILTRMEH